MDLRKYRPKCIQSFFLDLEKSVEIIDKDGISGILNKNKNILGMMPHPERMVDKVMSNEDGVNLFQSLLN